MGSGLPLSSLGLSPLIINKLIQSDFIYESDVKHLQPTELSEAVGLTLKEAAEVLRLVLDSTKIETKTLKQIIEEEKEVVNIVSFSKNLDTLLGGGILLNAITEVYGAPGTAKTQLCFQACVSVQIPEKVGGVEGQALFIDTEGSFNAGRIKEIAQHSISHVKSVADEELETFTMENILRGIHYIRCVKYIDLLSVLHHLPDLLQSHPKVRLIVVDSIAFHFRHDFADMRQRTAVLCALTQQLIQLANRHHLAVLLTNQMTTRVNTDGSSELVASLGETWGHCPTVRICLFWQGGTRWAKLTKAPHLPLGNVAFQVTEEGIRDTISSAECKNAEELKMNKGEFIKESLTDEQIFDAANSVDNTDVFHAEPCEKFPKKRKRETNQ